VLEQRGHIGISPPPTHYPLPRNLSSTLNSNLVFQKCSKVYHTQ
jgi:hypothetical protein